MKPPRLIPSWWSPIIVPDDTEAKIYRHRGLGASPILDRLDRIKELLDAPETPV